MDGQKQIVVIAWERKAEALRMASGLTLLDDVVRVFVVGTLDDDAETASQLEVLEFVEVPLVHIKLEDVQAMDFLACTIVASQAVYIL